MAPLIELEHIIDALQGFERPLREGREAIKNLVVVGIKSRSRDEVRVEAHCVRTTKINEDPVEIEVVIDTRSTKIEEKVKSISCTCKAGASKEHCCKHAMATLIYLERNEEDKLEKLTCTDVKQKWGIVKDAAQKVLSKFEPVPLKNFCHISSQHPPYRRAMKEVNTDLEAEFIFMFLKDQPESEAAVFLSGTRYEEETGGNDAEDMNFPLLPMIVCHALGNPSYILQRAAELGKELYMQCSPAQKEFFDNNVKISDQDAMDICLLTEQQSGDEWDMKRFGKLTGSISYSFYTYYVNKNPDWPTKIKRTFEPSSDGTTPDMENGLMYEGDAKDCYENKFNHQYKVAHPGFFNHPLTPWLGYSADGVIFEGDKILRLWENKTPKCGAQHGAATICNNLAYMGKKSNGKLKPKHPYYGQVQLGMLLLSLPVCDFTLYSMKFDEVYIDEVSFDEKFCLEFSERLTKVYFKHILPWLCSRGS